MTIRVTRTTTVNGQSVSYTAEAEVSDLWHTSPDAEREARTLVISTVTALFEGLPQE